MVEQRFEGFFRIGIVERFFKRMPGRKLPAAVDDAGAGIVGQKWITGNGCGHLEFSSVLKFVSGSLSSGTTVQSP